MKAMAVDGDKTIDYHHEIGHDAHEYRFAHPYSVTAFFR